MLPEKGELVIAKVREVFKAGAFCNLLEYDNQDAFIHISEVTSKWVRNIREFIKEDQIIVAKVIRIDPEKKQVDMSIKTVSEFEKLKTIELYKREIRGTKLIEVLAKKLGIELTIIKKNVEEVLLSKYDDVYSALEDISEKGEEAIKGFKFEKKINSALIDLARSNIKIREVHISGCLQVKVTEKGGLAILKDVFKKMLTKVPSLQIKYISAPKYELTVVAKDYKTADKALQTAIKEAETAFGKHFISFEKKKPS